MARARSSGRGRAWIAAAAAAAAAWLLPAAASGPAALAPLDDAKAWLPALLPAQREPATRFERVPLDGGPALRITAQGSYGNLVHTLSPAPLGGGTLRWRWQLEAAIEGADLRSKAGDDAALKVCALFDLPLERVPFVERQLLRLARAASGQALPAATVCYVWAPLTSTGAVIPNAHSRRMRWIVLQGQGSGPGVWREESRDLRADFLRAFGEESATVPPLVGILVGADADNTGGSGGGLVQDLRWAP
jgi:hypothetical protein